MVWENMLYTFLSSKLCNLISILSIFFNFARTVVVSNGDDETRHCRSIPKVLAHEREKTHLTYRINAYMVGDMHSFN